MSRNHSEKDELRFSWRIRCAVEQGILAEVRKLLDSVTDPYASGVTGRMRDRLNTWITNLWPARIRPLFPADTPPSLAYLQALVALGQSPYADCVKESAQRDARHRHDDAFLKAVDAADEASFITHAVDRSAVLKFCLSKDSPRPALGGNESGCLPVAGKVSAPVLLRWRLARILDRVLNGPGRALSAWEVLSALQFPVWPPNGEGLEEELARFAGEAGKAGVSIIKVPAACVALIGKKVSRRLLQFDVKDEFLVGADPAACKQIEAGTLRGKVESGDTRLGTIARRISDTEYGKAEFLLTGICDLFASLNTALPMASEDPAYRDFLVQAALPVNLRPNWWLAKDPGKAAAPQFKPVAQEAAVRLFGDMLPSGYGKESAWPRLVCEMAEAGRLGKLSGKLLGKLAAGLSSEDKARLVFAAPNSWKTLFSPNDPFFRTADWRVMLKAGVRTHRAELRKSLSEEKDASAYLRFAIEHLPAGDRGLGWLGDDGLVQRFIGDFKGTELWKRAGGAALSDGSVEALCRAWGNAPEGDPIKKEAARIIALGMEDKRLLGFMMTKAGLERCGGKLFQALLRANRFFDTDILGPEGSLKALEAFRKHSTPGIACKAAGMILQRLPELQALERAKAFLAEDACWIKGPLRSESELPILFGEYRRDPMGLAEALSKVKFPEALVKEKLLAYVKELQAAKAPYMVQASFGFFAGLWPDPNAKLVKWLVAAADWKEKPGHRLKKAYRIFNIPKKSGGKRKISAPIVALKRLQHSVLCDLIEPLGAHPAAMGFVKDRSILTNASVHVGKPVVAVTDVHNCFPSVKWPVLYRVLERDLGEKLGLPAVALIADLCTLDGGLPMGSPASPALLNRVLLKADEILAAEAEKRGCAYTRYADDLTFSGDDRAVELVGRAKSVLAKAGLEIDPKKTNIFRRGRRQRVTGLVVNEKAGVPRHYRRLVRAAADKFCRGGTPVWDGREMSAEELRGRIAFVAGVHPKEGAELLAKVAGEVARRGSEDIASQETKADCGDKEA